MPPVRRCAHRDWGNEFVRSVATASGLRYDMHDATVRRVCADARVDARLVVILAHVARGDAHAAHACAVAYVVQSKPRTHIAAWV